MRSLFAVMMRKPFATGVEPKKALCVVFFIVVALYYWWLITYGTLAEIFRPGSAPTCHFTIWVHMWERLLQGRVDVDPAIIEAEGFSRARKIHTSFGYFPAVLRGIASPFLDLQRRDIARISCLAAACLGLLFSVRLGLRLKLHEGASRPFFLVLVGMIALTGPCVFILGPTFVHTEGIIWGYTVLMYFADGYVSVFDDSSGSPVWKLLRLTLGCGAAFLIRPPFGFATALPLLWVVMTSIRIQLPGKGPVSRRLPARPSTVFDRRSVVVAGLAGLPIFLFVGYVNYQRWGNPLVFMVTEQSVTILDSPSELAMIRKYGDVNISQIPCGLEHYLVPHSDNFTREAPFISASYINESCARLPYSGRMEWESQIPLTITVPGFLIAALVGGISLTRAGGGLFGIPRSATVLLCAGLALPCVVVVAFIGRTLRYQIYFLPLLIVLSMAALSYVKKGEVLGRPIVGRTVLVVFGALFVYSACASHLVNVDVKLRGLGSAEDLKARTAEYVRSYLSGIERIAGVLGSDDQAMKDGLDALYGRGDAPHAARLFRRILERNPKHYGATYQLAVALDRAGDPAGARVYWERMLAMAEAARDEAMVAGVRARLGRAPTLEERQADAMKAGLEALYTKNDPVAAALHFRKVLSMSPGHYGATYQLAAALDRAGRREEATFFWEKVLEMAGKYHDGATMQTARSRLGKSP